MAEDVIRTPDSDIYSNWEKPPLRVDIPGYGPEYAQWKKETPPDVQKTVLDYMTARRIHTSWILYEKKPHELLNEQISQEEYPTVRQNAIKNAEDAIAKFRSLMEKDYPGLSSSIKAAGLDGSALYRPRKGGDVDVFVVFDEIIPEAKAILKKYKAEQAPRESKAGAIDLRAETLQIEHGPTGRPRLPWTILPHLLLQNSPSFMEQYTQAKQQNVELVRKNKNAYYDSARYLVAKKGYTWDELTAMTEK